MITKISAPVSIQIELTEKCNFGCFYCYNFWETRMKQLSMHEIELIMEQVNLNQIPAITITGGEPFVNKNGLFLMIELAEKFNIAVSVNSNFSLAQKIDLIKISKITKNVSFLISLPSANRQEYVDITKSSYGVYKKVLENIKRAQKLGFKVSLNMVLTKTNLNSLRETAQLAKELGVSTFCATKSLPSISDLNKDNFMLSVDEAIDSIRLLDEVSSELNLPVDILGCYPKCLLIKSNTFHKLLNRACVAGCTTLTIGADGDIRPCSHISQSYGNIFRESLKTAWDKMDGWKMNEFVPKDCLGCDLLNMCRGGCRVNNHENNLHALDYYTDLNAIKTNKLKLESLSNTELEVRSVEGNYVVNPIINFRKEDFGYLIYGNDRRAIVQFVNRKVGDYLKLKKDKKLSFSFADFLSESGAKTEEQILMVNNLFYKFYKKKLLILSQKGGI